MASNRVENAIYLCHDLPYVFATIDAAYAHAPCAVTGLRRFLANSHRVTEILAYGHMVTEVFGRSQIVTPVVAVTIASM